MLFFRNLSPLSLASILCGVIFSLAAAILINACEPLEITPQRPSGDWQILALTNETNSRLIEYAVSQSAAMQSGRVTRLSAVVSSPNLFSTSGTAGIGGRASKIIVFREFTFVILPEQRRIQVLNPNTYALIRTLDFTAQNRIPSDIARVNATTCFIAFENGSVVSILDISADLNTGVPRLVITADIPVGRNPVAFANRISETQNINEVYCALRGDNQIAVIKANGDDAYTVTARINVPTAPVYLNMTPDNEGLIVVSAGAGRFDNASRTAPRVSRLEFRTRSVTQTAPLITSADSTSNDVYGLAINRFEFAYIPTNTALYQVDIRNLFLTQPTLEGTFRSVNFNPSRGQFGEILLAEYDSLSMGTNCIIINPRTGRDSIVVPLPNLSTRPTQIYSR